MAHPTTPARRSRSLGVSLLALALVVAACQGRGFQPRRFSRATELYAASLGQFQKKKWDAALAGFDLLATQLPARDTLLPKVYFHQGQAHSRKGEHLLAAQAYQRIGDAFPDDSLADEALYQQAREYQALWRKPQLDAQYGTTSLATFRQVLSLYPDSPLAAESGKQIAQLNEWFATKDYDTGMHYFRRKAYDPGLIYFRDVVRLYPGTPAARRSYFRMVDSYKAINYKEELAEVCAEMRRFYPQDAEVAQTCPAVQPPSTATQPQPAPAAAPAQVPSRPVDGGASTRPAPSPAPVPPAGTPPTPPPEVAAAWAG
jgi:outer membrane protein assembly factor BamD